MEQIQRMEEKTKKLFKRSPLSLVKDICNTNTVVSILKAIVKDFSIFSHSIYCQVLLLSKSYYSKLMNP